MLAGARVHDFFCTLALPKHVLARAFAQRLLFHMLTRAPSFP